MSMRKHCAIMIVVLCSIAVSAEPQSARSDEERRSASEVRSMCNMASGELCNKQYEAALARLVSPDEMKQLTTQLATTQIVEIVRMRNAARLKRFLEYGKSTEPKISQDKAEAVYADKSISFTCYKSGGRWYVKRFDDTFFITRTPTNLPTDAVVIKEVNAYLDKAIEYLEQGKDKEALFLLVPTEQAQKALQENGEAALRTFREGKATLLLETLKKARGQKPKEIAWDKEWLHYRIGGDDFEIYRQGGKWCIGN